MNNRDFNKIVMVSLCDSYTKSFGNILSQNLDMIFCDTKDLIEYELIDKKTLEEISSKEYLKNSEKKVLKHIASFINVVVSINYDYLVNNLSIIKKGSLIIFLKFSKNYIKENGNTVDFIDFENRTKELENLADITINIRKTETNFVLEKVLNELGGIL